MEIHQVFSQIICVEKFVCCIVARSIQRGRFYHLFFFIDRRYRSNGKTQKEKERMRDWIPPSRPDTRFEPLLTRILNSLFEQFQRGAVKNNKIRV